ncbi:tyrosine-type recombinase/integrase [Ructibacterium gallinarum]|uniref:Tyrosine-type recombinase/integrase n=1 Tax=Ructibacterium gallinarum TaxID=2779355 RepID=A0A9D5M0T3_9FIRM|nr:tyrosine-type recombinase/integrase [Ructibacterium gallinarum]MBE5040537.1 tyrosine-type recombinase/integrase [Ructibacterium gallinarum]
MSMNDFTSTLAPAICELILQKRALGKRYIHGETLLGHFDRFCVEINYSQTTLTEELIQQWKEHNLNRKHRQQSQYLTYVRQLGQYLKSVGYETYIPPTEQYSGTADPIELNSPFAPYIKDFVLQKKAAGYDYQCGERALYRFDRFCVNLNINEPILSRDLTMEWLAHSTMSNASCFRQFAKYIISLGEEAYIIRKTPKIRQFQPYIMTFEELSNFFEAVDEFAPDYRSSDRMAASYSIMFRLYYCCGMRLQEVCNLKVEDVDLKSGKILVLNSKGQKDRIVFMHEDLRQMCDNYDAFVKKTLLHRTWFFTAKHADKPICKSNMTRRFHYFWDIAYGDKNTIHYPTVHSLRHTFVVNKINSWILEGKDMSQMLPYLSRYLGHKTIEETHYYYHLAITANEIIRQKDIQSKNVIPEVMPYEEI